MGGGGYLAVEAPGRERQSGLVVRLVLSVQEVLQALLQRLIGHAAAGRVDELRVQVEGSRRGAAGGLAAAMSLQAGLEDVTQFWRCFLQEAKGSVGNK